MAAMTTERRMQLIQALAATRKAYKSVSDRARSAIREVLQ